MKRRFITLILALALTIGAQAQQDDGMDAMMAGMPTGGAALNE